MSDIDTVIDRFEITVTKARHLGTVEKALIKTLDKHYMLNCTRIEKGLKRDLADHSD